jgi:hypothetical protein
MFESAPHDLVGVVGSAMLYGFAMLMIMVCPLLPDVLHRTRWGRDPRLAATSDPLWAFGRRGMAVGAILGVPIAVAGHWVSWVVWPGEPIAWAVVSGAYLTHVHARGVRFPLTWPFAVVSAVACGVLTMSTAAQWFVLTH